jgi:hypothetical protein
MTALVNAATIGASQVGERYVPTDAPWSIGDLLRFALGGTERPPHVAALDPFGIEAWERGAGPMPMPVMGTTEPTPTISERFPRLAKVIKGYYSRAEQPVLKMPASGVHPNKAAQMLSAASSEELSYRGVPAFLAGQEGKVTPGALAAHLEAHPLPPVQVKTLETPPLIGHDMQGNPIEEYRASSTGQPKFAQYQVPGGADYTETLFTLPTSGRSDNDFYNGKFIAWIKDTKGMTRDQALNQSESWMDRARAEYLGQGAFKSSHFDEPNILVHTRSNTREVPGLGKGLFLEEVQSDWHQKGKAGGYQVGENLIDGHNYEYWNNQADSLFNMRSNPHLRSQISAEDLPRLEADLAQARENRNRLSIKAADVVPDAPFKDTWPDLALKHHVLDAAQNPETQWLGFTSGETQVKRYPDLSKFISEVHYSGTNLKAYDLEGKVVINQSGISREQLPEYIGQEVTKKLLAQPKQGTLQSLHGVDLEVGPAKGQYEFYDKKLPKRLEKIVKPFGGTVERVHIPAGIAEGHHGTRALGEAFFDAAQPGSLINGKLPVGPSRKLYSREQLGTAFLSGELNAFNMPNYLQNAVQAMGGVKEPAWIVKLTPEMKAKILKAGLPFMSLLGAAVQPVPSHEEQ